MDGDDQISSLAVRNRGAGFEWNESVVLACVNDFGAEPGFEQTAEALGHVEHHVLLAQTVGTNGAGVMTPVTSVNDDLANLQTECANQRPVADGCRTRLTGRFPSLQTSIRMVGSVSGLS